MVSSPLPQKLPLDQMQTKWASAINPILLNPMTNMVILTNIQLKIGTNVINHMLGQQQQGWVLIDKTAACNPYRSAPFNNLTLTLTSDAAATISLGVF